MKLADRCSKSFDDTITSLGQGHFRAGQVEIDELHDDAVLATVEDAGRRLYDVEVDWSDLAVGELNAYCTCPRYQVGHLCEHIWALLLMIDDAGLAPGIWGSFALRVVHDDDSLEDEEVLPHQADDDRYEYGSFGRKLPSFITSPNGKAGGRPNTPTPPRPTTKANADWRRQLALIHRDTSDRSAASFIDNESLGRKQREIWYAVNVADSMRDGRLVVDLQQRETTKDGELGAYKQLTVTNRSLPQLVDGDDRKLVQMLLGNQASYDSYTSTHHDSFGYSRSGVSPGLYDVLLPRLCQTNRLVWRLSDSVPMAEAKSLTWDDGPAWQFQVRIAEDNQGQCWRIGGEFFRDQERLPIEEPVLLLSNGLMLLADRLVRLDAAAHFGWISTLRKTGSLAVPYADRADLLELLWSMPDSPQLDLPEALKLQETRIQPQGRFCIKSPDRIRYGASYRLYAQVTFLYGDHEFPIETNRAAIVDVANGNVVLRDRSAERVLLQELKALSLQPTDSYIRGEAQFQFPPKRLPDIVRTLTESGWQVESEGTRVRRAGSFSLSVSSDVDWFELDASVDFDGVKASLPALLTALRERSQYIRLDDGSQGMLPEDWLKKYGRLAELGEQEGDTLRFSHSQALLLDALLAEQDDVQVDEKFDRWRQKLQSFEGIDPAKEPRGFHGELRAYQREGLGWLGFLREFRFGGCLADDMGLGKTVQVLAMLQQRRMRRVPKGESKSPSIVVVPKSLIFNWMEEAARFAPRLRVLNYTGIDRHGLLDQLADHDLLLTTYGTLRRDIIKLKDRQFDYAILDESQAIKNANSQAAKACRLLKADHRLAMTGTPVENHLGELWSLFEFLNPGMLGRSYAFGALAKNGRNGEAVDSLPMLAKAVKPFLLRRTKSQVLTELPEKTEQTLHCEMPPKQRRLYDELRDFYRTSLQKKVKQKGLNKSKIHVLEALLRLRQAACHPGLIDKKLADDSSAKLDLLLEQIQEITKEGHKALVFSQFTSLLSIVRQRLDSRKIPYAYLDGQTRRRADSVKQFQEDPDCPLFLISLKAGGHGLNLTAADYVYILDPWWNPAVEAQAIDRAHRLGQEQHVFAYRMICRDTVEEKIVELQKSKRELADAIISADNNLIRNLTAEDLELLLS